MCAKHTYKIFFQITTHSRGIIRMPAGVPAYGFIRSGDQINGRLLNDAVTPQQGVSFSVKYFGVEQASLTPEEVRAEFKRLHRRVYKILSKYSIQTTGEKSIMMTAKFHECAEFKTQFEKS